MDTVAEFKQLRLRSFEINLRMSNIAAILDGAVTNTALSLAANNHKSLTYPELVAVRNLIQDCEELVRRAGAPINFRDTVAVKRLLEAYREHQARPAVLGSSDWDLMRRIVAGETPAEICLSTGISMSVLLEKLDIATNRFELTASEIRCANSDQKSLTDTQLAESAARKLAR